jgi:hypothetical protein
VTSALPADAVRAAVAAEDWDAASARLDEYDAALRARFDSADERPLRDECERLLAAHRALATELAVARDAAAEALRRFQRDRRGVQAYLGGGA